jgi:hypothetical protein
MLVYQVADRVTSIVSLALFLALALFGGRKIHPLGRGGADVLSALPRRGQRYRGIGGFALPLAPLRPVADRP